MADCQEELLFQHLCHRESGESAASVGTTVTAEADVTAEAAGTAWTAVLINTLPVA